MIAPCPDRPGCLNLYNLRLDSPVLKHGSHQSQRFQGDHIDNNPHLSIEGKQQLDNRLQIARRSSDKCMSSHRRSSGRLPVPAFPLIPPVRYPFYLFQGIPFHHRQVFKSGLLSVLTNQFHRLRLLLERICGLYGAAKQRLDGDGTGSGPDIPKQGTFPEFQFGQGYRPDLALCHRNLSSDKPIISHHFLPQLIQG